jgi:hypothetical protein
MFRDDRAARASLPADPGAAAIPVATIHPVSRRHHLAAGWIALAAWLAVDGRGPSLRAAGTADTFDPKTASFAVTFQGERSAYREMSTFVLPGTSITFAAAGGPPADYAFGARDGAMTTIGPRSWRWKAPDAPGVYPLTFSSAANTESITLHVFVMVPAARVTAGLLNGYRIGAYPSKPLNGNPIYLPPAGFVEITKANQDTKVSPHFTLKQFICKEDATNQFPKYVVVKERLLLKLEAILERVNALGFRVDTLHVMSAYRTPYYNHAIGDVPYSLHQFGSAADIFVDRTGRGRMDDLNADGVVDTGDSKFLYDEIEKLLAAKDRQIFQGGMGFYRATSAHPPFVHVDVRGTKARWRG